MTAGKDRTDRAERERVRQYRARQQLHADRVRRRVRDNVFAGVIGGLLILGIGVAQTVYFVSGPGAPTPTPVVVPVPTEFPLPVPVP